MGIWRLHCLIWTSILAAKLKHNREPPCVDWKLKRKDMLLMGMMIVMKEAQWQCWSRTTRKQRSVTRLQTWVCASPPPHWTGMSLTSIHSTSLSLADQHFDVFLSDCDAVWPPEKLVRQAVYCEVIKLSAGTKRGQNARCNMWLKY